jgi:hypothetical protein
VFKQQRITAPFRLLNPILICRFYLFETYISFLQHSTFSLVVFSIFCVTRKIEKSTFCKESFEIAVKFLHFHATFRGKIMTTDLKTQEQSRPQFRNLISKWMVALPLFSSRMVILTAHKFFRNSAWENLRAKGELLTK